VRVGPQGYGWQRRVVIDIDKKRREAALAIGAIAAIDGAAPDALARIAETLTGPYWAAIDLVGSPSTAGLAFDSLARGAKLIMVGLFGGVAVAVAFDSDEGRDNLGQLHRKPR
jgi:alcohol dehydrogenase, propanol-preferring